MPRTLGSKNRARKSPFKSYEGRDPDDNHVRLTCDMLAHPAYQSLSGSAVKLYQYMRWWAKGRDSVKYAATLTESFMTRKTFYKARDELCEKGFIYWRNKPSSSNKRYEAGIYEFSDTWHTRKPHCPEPPVEVHFNRVESTQQVGRKYTAKPEKQTLCEPRKKSSCAESVQQENNTNDCSATTFQQMRLY